MIFKIISHFLLKSTLGIFQYHVTTTQYTLVPVLLFTSYSFFSSHYITILNVLIDNLPLFLVIFSAIFSNIIENSLLNILSKLICNRQTHRFIIQFWHEIEIIFLKNTYFLYYLLLLLCIFVSTTNANVYLP